MISEIIVYSIITVAVWMFITQTVRYVMHEKKHADDPIDSKDYDMAHSPNAIYWAIPAIFVIFAVSTGVFVSSIITHHMSLSGTLAYIMPVVVSLGAYILMDYDRQGVGGIISRVCNAIYYVFVEKTKDNGGRQKLISEVVAELRKKEGNNNE